MADAIVLEVLVVRPDAWLLPSAAGPVLSQHFTIRGRQVAVHRCPASDRSALLGPSGCGSPCASVHMSGPFRNRDFRRVRRRPRHRRSGVAVADYLPLRQIGRQLVGFLPDHLVILATRGFASRPVQHGDQPALVGNRPQLLKTRRGLEHAFAADPEHVAYELLSHRQAAAAQAIHRQQRPATQPLVDQVLQRDDGIGRKSDVSHGAARLMHHGPQWQRHQFQVWEQSTLNFWRQGSQQMILLGLGPGRHSALRLRGA